ncbi:hypothetical protein A4X13_0g3381 [Tilletia indica]|uniref:Uncharacterized protein n=1 Tax=Tilletia indica TaxID=43049 RepID=A0A8T8T462_9BASI|nr:hypothetical protein A4X13_0g3381 [Tilletia indica]
MLQQIHDLLGDDNLTGQSLGEAIIRSIDVQVNLHAEQDSKYQEVVNQDITALSESAQAAVRVAIELGRASEGEAESIRRRVPHMGFPEFSSTVLNADHLPYAILCRALHFASTAPTMQTTKTAPIDEWITRNESYMRARLILDQTPKRDPPYSLTKDEEGSSLSLLGIDKSASHWQHFLVGLGRDEGNVFPASGPTSPTIHIHRPAKAELPGLRLLDPNRKDTIEMNTLTAFQSRFDSMTFGALRGLDWRNILVAGDLVSAALTSVTDEETKQSAALTLDLYVYGLTIEQANAKLQAIESVFASNLPLDKDTNQPMEYAVLRNSQAITFVPAQYPYRRIQVVLKLCPNPMAILLDFDLDQAAVGYSGYEVWMLPRASRAFVTGYATFSMNLIHGPVLAPRRGAQDQRVFKYGERGYGLRFLPSYIDTLPTVSLEEKTTTEKDLSEESLPRDELSVTLREERERMAWWVASKNHMFRFSLQDRHVSVASVEIETDEASEITDQRSLSRWQRFARHVALWEQAQLGYFLLDADEDLWGAEFYFDEPLSHNSGPDMHWNASFSLNSLIRHVESENLTVERTLSNSLVEFGSRPLSQHDYANPSPGVLEAEEMKFSPKRVIIASSLLDAFAEPLVAVIILPKNLHSHAAALLQGSTSFFADVIDSDARPEPVRDATSRSRAESKLLFWIQGLHCGEEVTKKKVVEGDVSIAPHWQLVSRETDEVHEVLHTFRRSLHDSNPDASVQSKKVRTQISKTFVRQMQDGGEDVFKRWACTRDRVDLRGLEGLGVGGPEEILRMPRWAVFGRFDLSANDTFHLIEEVYQIGSHQEERDEEYDAEMGGSSSHTEPPETYEPPKTLQEWIATSFDEKWPGMLWFRQTVPSIHWLPELANGSTEIPVEPDPQQYESSIMAFSSEGSYYRHFYNTHCGGYRDFFGEDYDM